MKLSKIDYSSLNARQKENYNFQKISGILADYGFVTIRLSDDWGGADFIAKHINGDDYIKVQLKGRLTIDKKYIGKNVWIAFPSESDWYMIPHDEMLDYLLSNSDIGKTDSWVIHNAYSIVGGIGKKHRTFFAKFKLA
jgi:hypothetical protein